MAEHTITPTPAPRERITAYEWLWLRQDILGARHCGEFSDAWKRLPDEYHAAADRLASLAYTSGRVVEHPDGRHLVVGAVPGVDELHEMKPAHDVAALVDLAYAMLVADLADPDDVRTVAGPWAHILPETLDEDPPRPRSRRRDPRPAAPVDAAPTPPQPDKARRRELLRAARKRRRLALLLAAATFVAAAVAGRLLYVGSHAGAGLTAAAVVLLLAAAGVAMTSADRFTRTAKGHPR